MSIASDPDLVPDFDGLARLTRQLPETDGIPMDSPWHRAQTSLSIRLLTFRWQDREDFFVGGNMFLYYGLNKGDQFAGPDFFYVSGVERRRPRLFWAVWDEGGRYPDLIIEYLSPSTAENDLTIKKTLYERTFRTPEYYCYDPATTHLDGWH